MAEESVIIDLTDYKDRFGERVDPGRYTVVVSDAELDQSKNGNPMVNLWLEVINDKEFEGATIIDRLTQSKNAMFRTVNFMRAAGMPTPKARQAIPIRAFIGKIIEVDVEDGQPYNGTVKSEVRGYMPSPLNKKKDKGGDLDDFEEPEDLDETDETEEVEEVEEKPAPKRRRKKKPEPQPEPEDVDEDDSDDDGDDDDVELDELEF